MDFQHFINCIPKIITEKLPAESAHLKMMPPERKALIKNLNLETIDPKKAAVMMLFYPKNTKVHLVLIVRNKYNGVHSSQIAFPGGKVEITDTSFSHTARRETEEEIGVPQNKIELIKAFTEVYIPPSNFIVYPFLGYSLNELSFNLDPNEVKSIIEIPLMHFLDDKIIVIKKMTTSYSESIDVPAFKIEEHYVWGATAMILSELKETLKKVL